MDLPLLSLGLLLLWALAVGYVIGRFGRHRERQIDFSSMRVEYGHPLPPYLHVIDFDPLEFRPTVREIEPEAPVESEVDDTEALPA